MKKSTNTKIVEAAYRALIGQSIVENGSSGWCLRVTRQIIQEALRISQDEFYAMFLKTKAPETNPDAPYARDIQLSFRSLGYSVTEDEVLPGDLFFSWKPMPYGHVGIVLTPEYVLENSTGSRAVARNGFLCVSRLDDVKRVMPVEFFRIP